MQRTASKTDQELIDLLKAEAPKKPSNVNLEGRDIQVLPAEIGLFTDCERMGLNNNSLVTLPLTFAQFPFLKYLNLRSNRFREFPSALLSLPKLEVLDISKNKISAFPADPGLLINLKVLSVSRNRLESLPKYLPVFKNLKLLKIDNNPLKWPPHTITTCLDESDKKWITNLFQYISENEPLEALPVVAATKLDISEPQVLTITQTQEADVPDILNAPNESQSKVASALLYCSKELLSISKSISTLQDNVLEKDIHTAQTLYNNLLENLKCGQVQPSQIKAIVLHLIAMMQEIENTLIVNNRHDHYWHSLYLDWDKADNFLKLAIKYINPDYIIPMEDELQSTLTRIFEKLTDNRDKNIVLEAKTHTSKERITNVLQICKDCLLNDLGFELVVLAKRLLK